MASVRSCMGRLATMQQINAEVLQGVLDKAKAQEDIKELFDMYDKYKLQKNSFTSKMLTLDVMLKALKVEKEIMDA